MVINHMARMVRTTEILMMVPALANMFGALDKDNSPTSAYVPIASKRLWGGMLLGHLDSLEDMHSKLRSVQLGLPLGWKQIHGTPCHC